MMNDFSGVAAAIGTNYPNTITKADIYNARYTELVKLEEFLKGHIEQLDADYHAKKDPTSHDTVAYYVSKTMCVQFQRQLIKMHSQVTDDQFKGVVEHGF